ncbi:MAG: GNAT family N-acetyltransferase [Sulfitobacter sp.]
MIRAAREDDAAGIADLWNGMIRSSLATFTSDEKSVADVAGLIAARPGAFWVADAGAGFITWGAFRGGPGYQHTAEHSIITARPGQGVGRALLQHGLAAAGAQGVHVMVAAISGANPGAQAFHARHGFAEVGRMPQVGRKSGRWLDLILMQKLLIGA